MIFLIHFVKMVLSHRIAFKIYLFAISVGPLAGRGGVICSLLHTENYEPSLFALKRTQGFVPCRRIK